MATSVYVAAVEGYTGKSTVALGVLEQLSRRVERVAVYRPVVRGDAATDYVLDLLVSHDAVQLTYDECAGVTYADVHRDPEGALDRIVDRFHQVAAKVDAVVVVGSDYTDVGAPTEFSFNARLAANLGSPVLLVLNAHDRTLDGISTAADLAVSELNANHGTLFAIVANRADGDLRGGRQGARRARRPGVRAAGGAAAERAVGGRPDGRLRRHPRQRRGVAAVAGEHGHRGRGDDAAARARPALRGRGRGDARRPARGGARRADRAGVGELPADGRHRAQRRVRPARSRSPG